MNFYAILKQGQVYLKTWPLDPRLGIIFPENRVIKATEFAKTTMPVMAIFTLVWHFFYAANDQTSLAISVTCAIFSLLLPLQGFYWLGKRANTTLSPQSASWFYQIRQKLGEANVTQPVVEGSPTYQHLAEVLKQGLEKLDADFWQGV